MVSIRELFEVIYRINVNKKICDKLIIWSSEYIYIYL